MYNITLVNLAADARSVAAFAYFEQRGAGNEELRVLLRNFCEIDPVENASADTEIRVQVRHESYLIRTELKKLVIRDVHRRELPGQILTVEQAMHELDGTAATARNQAIQLARAEAGPSESTPVVPMAPPPVVSSKPRLIAMSVAVGLLLGGIIYLSAPFGAAATPAGFVPAESADLAALQASLDGVYLTGSEPGQHGMVVSGPSELKLFELGAVEAPRVVYAACKIGRVGPRLCLVTDQPGGVIAVAANGTLIYCGETYQRIP